MKSFLGICLLLFSFTAMADACQDHFADGLKERTLGDSEASMAFSNFGLALKEVYQNKPDMVKVCSYLDASITNLDNSISAFRECQRHYKLAKGACVYDIDRTMAGKEEFECKKLLGKAATDHDVVVEQYNIHCN